MTGMMEAYGFLPPGYGQQPIDPGMSPFGMLRQPQGPAPLPMPPGMVSPFAFAPGTQQGMGQSVAPGLAAFGQMAPSALQGPSSAPMPMADAPAPQAANAGPALAPSAVMAAAGNSGFPMPPEGRSQGSIDRQRRMAESLMQQGMSSAPIGHWTQGGARLVQALSGSVLNNRADADEKSNQKANREFLASLLGGGGASANPMAGEAATPGNNPAQQAITRTAGPAKSSPQTVETAGRLMSDLQRDFGLTPQQAAGVAGNLAHESGGFRTLQEIRPMVPGSRGGFGYAQWTGPRRVAFENWSRQNGLDPTSYEANYGFLKHELQNTGEGRVLGALRQAPDVGTATQIFSNQFLRPGIPAMGSRMAFAQQFGNLAGQQGAPVPSNPAANALAAGSGAPMPQQPPGIAPRAPGIAGMDPQRLLLAAAFTNDPNMKQTLGALAQMQAQQGRVQYQTLPDGTILALDPSGRRPPTPVYQAPQKPILASEGQRLVNPQTGQVIGDGGGSKISREVSERQQQAVAQGMDPKDPRTQQYALTGQLPKPPEPSASDKKAILEADEAVATNRSVIQTLQEAKKLSAKAWGGVGAGMAANVFAPFSQGAQDTRELNNLVSAQALGQLKAIFGGNPTEGERKILLDLQAGSSIPDPLRQKILDRGIEAAQRRLKMNEERAAQMRGGQYFKPGNVPSVNKPKDLGNGWSVRVE